MCDVSNPIPWIALIVSIVSAGFAGSALWVSREKLRLDLYNKRFPIFRAAVDLRNLHFRVLTKGHEANQDVLDDFFRAKEEAAFLFKDSDGVKDLLDRMHEASFNILQRESRPGLELNSPDELSRYHESKMWIQNQSMSDGRSLLSI
jgi:hypothetical protein